MFSEVLLGGLDQIKGLGVLPVPLEVCLVVHLHRGLVDQIVLDRILCKELWCLIRELLGHFSVIKRWSTL